MSTTNPNPAIMSFDELRDLANQARRKAVQARKSKRNFRLYLKLADSLEQLVREHDVLVQLTRGLITQLADRERLERKETADADQR